MNTNVKRSALAQALRLHGCTYREISRLMHISTRGVWLHIKADHAGRRAWKNRPESERSQAEDAAMFLIAHNQKPVVI